MAQKGYFTIRVNSVVDYAKAKMGLEHFFKKNDLCPKCHGLGVKSRELEDEGHSIDVQFSHNEQLVKLKEACEINSEVKFSTIFRNLIMKGLKIQRDCKYCNGSGFIKK